jgi:carbohydrate kinase (thermoresistant glucokinase family)
MTVFVLMGVAGAGKSTVGRRVSDGLALTFIEGDDFHPQSNVQKMAAGTPLTDEDREPWIEALAKGINARRPKRDAVVACSALRRFVRDLLRERVAEPTHFILLHADTSILHQRLAERPQHFMKPGMLRSQLEALEWPSNAMVIDAASSFDTVCGEVVEYIQASTVHR